MASLFKRKEDKGVPGTKYRISFDDENGIRRQRTAFEDKGESMRLLREIEIDVNRKKRGYVDPFEQHRDRPIMEHFEDFARFVASKGRGAKYLRELDREFAPSWRGSAPRNLPTSPPKSSRLFWQVGAPKGVSTLSRRIIISA